MVRERAVGARAYDGVEGNHLRAALAHCFFQLPRYAFLGDARLYPRADLINRLVRDADSFGEQREFVRILKYTQLFNDAGGGYEFRFVGVLRFLDCFQECLMAGDGYILAFEAYALDAMFGRPFGEPAEPALGAVDVEVGRLIARLLDVAKVGGERGFVAGYQKPAGRAGEAGHVAAVFRRCNEDAVQFFFVEFLA